LEYISMNNFLPKILKFLLVFFLFTFVSLTFHFLVFQTPTQKMLSLYSDVHIRSTCPSSPIDISFTECFRKNIPKLAAQAFPIDFMLIFQNNKKMYERDLYYNKFPMQNTVLEFLYYENISILVDYMTNYGINRQSLRFIQIISLPVIKVYFKYKFQSLKKDMLAFEKNNTFLLSTEKYKTRWENVSQKLFRMFID